MISTNKQRTRRTERIYYRLPFNMVIKKKGKKVIHQAMGIDISELGARLLAGIVLSPGQVVEIYPKGAAKPVQGRVVWVGDTGTEQAGEIGLEFVHKQRTRTKGDA
jgi:PilZ domain